MPAILRQMDLAGVAPKPYRLLPCQELRCLSTTFPRPAKSGLVSLAEPLNKRPCMPFDRNRDREERRAQDLHSRDHVPAHPFAARKSEGPRHLPHWLPLRFAPERTLWPAVGVLPWHAFRGH